MAHRKRPDYRRRKQKEPPFGQQIRPLWNGNITHGHAWTTRFAGKSDFAGRQWQSARIFFLFFEKKEEEISRHKNEQKTNAEITYRLCDAIFCLQGRAPTTNNAKQCRMQAQTTTSHNRMPAGVFRPVEGSHSAASSWRLRPRSRRAELVQFVSVFFCRRIWADFLSKSQVSYADLCKFYSNFIVR